MGRQHPPKIKNEEHKKQDYPKTINEPSMKTIDETIEKTPHEMSHKNKPKHSN